MTVIEASNLIFNYFKTNDSYRLDKDFNKVVTISSTPELDKLTISAALEKFVKTDLVTNKVIIDEQGKSEQVWILNRPLMSFEQMVKLSGEMSDRIASFLNDFSEGQTCENCGENCDECDYQVDPLQLTEKDIDQLFQYTMLFLQDASDLQTQVLEKKGKKKE